LDDGVFDQLAVNTNLYAKGKMAVHLQLSQNSQQTKAGREWKETTTSELSIFVGLMIKM